MNNKQTNKIVTKTKFLFFLFLESDKDEPWSYLFPKEN